MDKFSYGGSMSGEGAGDNIDGAGECVASFDDRNERDVKLDNIDERMNNNCGGKVRHAVHDNLDDSLESDINNHRTSLQPRIEMFNDSESNDSNPFMISSFFSLSASPEQDEINSQNKETSSYIKKELNEKTTHGSDENVAFGYCHGSLQQNGINQTFEIHSEVSVATDNEKSNSDKLSKFTNRSDNESQNVEPVKLVNDGKESDSKVTVNNHTNKNDDSICVNNHKKNGDIKTDLEDENQAFESQPSISLEKSTVSYKNMPSDASPFTQESCDNSSDSNMSVNNYNKLYGDDDACKNNDAYLRSKKSRKQNVPKRIMRDSDDISVAMDTATEKKCVMNASAPSNHDVYMEIDDVKTKTEYVNGVHDKKNDELDVRSTTDVGNKTGDIAENVNEINHCNKGINLLSPSQSSFQYYGLEPYITGYQHQNISNESLLKSPNTATGFALNETGPETLEVIRHLREIRCNRYRKISMVEKREISGYASAYGVSQAAAFYNVSKSAVSMWTKLDFSQVDENSPRNKRNCMIGNEKFEALCRRVRIDKETKFKNMSKLDKFEVSRYAKLVGVREMARCLDIALGTVSGWMRQFPYKIESKTEKSPEETLDDTKDNTSIDKSNVNIHDKADKRKTPVSGKRKIIEHAEDVKGEKEKFETVQEDDKMYILPTNGTRCLENSGDNTSSPSKQMKLEEMDSNSSHADDEVDQLIADTLQKPDVGKCFEDIKEMIKDTPLEGDDFFHSLFDRVVACRADKYKTLKPSEKLEVVRYAKRIGVRRIAKILGLATGTLSGWNTKYQDKLSLTDPTIESSAKTDSLGSCHSPNSNTEDQSTESIETIKYNMDNNRNREKKEINAVKLLFKDNYEVMLHKIEVAKQIKFRNINNEEKIEFVKCSKLVGIRPTARVFGIPIGTLSGWITKYTKTLHPAYHVEGDVSLNGSIVDIVPSLDQTGTSLPLMVGRNPEPRSPFMGLQSGESPDSSWPYQPSLSSISSNSEFNPLSYLSSSHNSNYQYRGFDTSTLTGLAYEENHMKKDTSDINSENQTKLDITAMKQDSQLENQSSSLTETMYETDEKAKIMAQEYLKLVYQKMGLSNTAL